jgi:hypothetical protein
VALYTPLRSIHRQRQSTKGLPDEAQGENGSSLSRLKVWITELSANPGVRLYFQLAHIAASLLFVVLYVWSTYSSPCQSSWRYKLDLTLCTLFALDYAFRMLVRPPGGTSWRSLFLLCSPLDYAFHVLVRPRDGTSLRSLSVLCLLLSGLCVRMLVRTTGNANRTSLSALVWPGLTFRIVVQPPAAAFPVLCISGSGPGGCLVSKVWGRGNGSVREGGKGGGCFPQSKQHPNSQRKGKP